MAEFPLEIIDKILGFRGGGLDLILFYYLKRAMRAVDVEFGLSLLFEKDEKLISMAKVGEFSEKERIVERGKGRSGILPIILKSMEPYISNDLEKDPFHLSFRDEEVGSELEYPFCLMDGRKSVLILLSKRKNHFKEKHLKEIKRIVKEMSSVIEKAEKGGIKRAVALFNCNKFGNILQELLGREYELLPFSRLENISSFFATFQIEFIFKECELRCSKDCKNVFSLSRETFIPVGILRPFSFNHKNSLSFSCSIYSPLSLSPIQESIRDLIKESKYHITSEKWQFENLSDLNIAFIQKHIIENHLENSNIRSISRHFNLSLSHLSRTFRSITGINLKGFIDRIKMCNSLFQLIDERPIEKVASASGYCDRFSFCRAFRRIFSFSPSEAKKGQI